jgi:hypothetical protein
MRGQVYTRINHPTIPIRNRFLHPINTFRNTNLDINAVTSWHLWIPLDVFHRHVDFLHGDFIDSVMQLDNFSTTAEDFWTAGYDLDYVSDEYLPFLGLGL